MEDRYECIWAHDKAAEKAALESFVDTVCALRAQHPGMHVFHYAPHEASKLRSLSVEHATHEAEVDDLLRHDVLVDLYAVVRQAVQVGEESYSLKKLERHHGFRRLETTVREGGGSIIAYETWLETAAAELLEAIRAYNEEDCRSTLSLRDWLLNELRPEAELEFAMDFRGLVPEEEDVLPEPAWLPEVNALIRRLELGLPADPGEDDPGQAERRLLAHLLLYHRRESKPEWWRHFELLDMTLVELEYERDALSGLVRIHDVEPITYKRSLDYAFTFPPQEFKLEAKSSTSRRARPTRSSRSRTTASTCAAARTHPRPPRRRSSPPSRSTGDRYARRSWHSRPSWLTAGTRRRPQGRSFVANRRNCAQAVWRPTPTR